MRVTVKLFGHEARSLGGREASVDMPGESPTCRDLRVALSAQHPALAASLASCRFAVNHQFVADDHAIHPGDEVALIGAVSGG